MKLIDKSALVAEIERRRKDWRYGSSIEAKYKREECDDILYFLDTLETKEVDEEYNGKAMLYILNKGVEQGKREMLDKACKYLHEHLLDYWQQSVTDDSNFINDFRKVMEE